jgi:hypothetical protein
MFLEFGAYQSFNLEKPKPEEKLNSFFPKGWFGL